MNKKLNIIFTSAFCAALVIPVISLNYGKLTSDTENRTLAAFPSALDEDRKFNKGFFYDLADWFEDHLGFRDDMMKVYSNIMVNGFGLSSSERVVFGKDGWMFYTPDHNLELVKGGYPLDGKMLETIAHNQQRINDYYKSMGKEYFLVITPSKATVYPEYIADGDYTVGTTAADILTDYIKANTDVKVINVKDGLIPAKEAGQLYLKTDTHWNQLGSYNAYSYILSQMKEYGCDYGEPVSVTFGQGEYQGEFSAMLGSPDVLKPEKTPVAEWEKSFEEVAEGSVYTAMNSVVSSISEMNAKAYPPAYFVNDSLPESRKLYIYGDSQWAAHGNMPTYLCENFSEVMSTRIRSVNYAADSAYDPDVVIFGCSERFIDSVLTLSPKIPAESYTDSGEYDGFATLPAQTSDEWIGSNGMWIEDQAEGNTISLSKAKSYMDMLQISGWAADFESDTPLTDLIAEVNGKKYRCSYGFEKKGVADKFGDGLLRTGFTLWIPDGISAGDKITFTMVNSGTQTVYEPVTYEFTE